MTLSKASLEAPLTDPHLRVVAPMPDPVTQSGCTCKLVALGTAMSHAERWDPRGKAIPVRRCDVAPKPPRATATLRSQAKQHVGSQVGEVYEAEHLAALARLNGFADAHTERPAQGEYIQRLRDLVDQNQVPVVFYAANVYTGAPDRYVASDNNEHSAAVVGYTRVQGRLAFVLAHWSKYQVVDAETLAASTAQLPEHTGETFAKVNLLGAGVRWVDEAYLERFGFSGSKRLAPERRSSAGAPSMRHGIVVLGTQDKPVALSWWRRAARTLVCGGNA